MVTLTSSLGTTWIEYNLLPRLTTKAHTPDAVSLKTPLVKYTVGEKPELCLNIPFTSAAMQAVTGYEMGISLAREGGLGFVNCSQPIEAEADNVQRVKDFKAGFVLSKANLAPGNTLENVLNLTEKTGYSTIPITADGRNGSELLGIITKNDFWRGYDAPDTPVDRLMTPFSSLAYGLEGITISEANAILRKHKKSCIPIVDSQDEKRLKYLVFKKDRDHHKEFPLELIDGNKRLLVGAAINSKDFRERVPAVLEAGADVLVVDTSDGYSEYVADALGWVKANYPDVKIGAGNVVEQEGFRYLAEHGADFVKVGIGGGSICSTQEVKGIGRGQVSAVMDVVAARDRYCNEKGIYIPVCSDGGLMQDSHITMALAFGADFVMMGRYFARFEESPTEKKLIEGIGLAKPYWGEATDRAKNWQRYHLGGKEGLSFEEGIDGWVPYAGQLSEGVRKSLAVMRSTMCNLGCLTIDELHRNAIVERRSPASITEGKPHDIMMNRDNLWKYSQMSWGA